MGRISELSSPPVTVVENEHDEADILADQDETKQPGGINFSSGEVDAFVRGEIDVKEQMDRVGREIDFPNRAAQARTSANQSSRRSGRKP